jgi:hypothetical protein
MVWQIWSPQRPLPFTKVITPPISSALGPSPKASVFLVIVHTYRFLFAQFKTFRKPIPFNFVQPILSLRKSKRNEMIPSLGNKSKIKILHPSHSRLHCIPRRSFSFLMLGSHAIYQPIQLAILSHYHFSITHRYSAKALIKPDISNKNFITHIFVDF